MSLKDYYLPIPGLESVDGVIPHTFTESLFSTTLHAQNNGLIVLPCKDIAKTIYFLERGIDSYESKRISEDNDISQHSVKKYFKELKHILNTHSIKPREILLWKYSDLHPRITSIESYLIMDYHLTNDYRIDVSKIQPNPIIPIEWPKTKREITPEIRKKLGLQSSIIIYSHDYDPECDGGLRCMILDRNMNSLYPNHSPYGSNSSHTSLLGVKKQ
jgi:hypothetical protein